MNTRKSWVPRFSIRMLFCILSLLALAIAQLLSVYKMNGFIRFQQEKAIIETADNGVIGVLSKRYSAINSEWFWHIAIPNNVTAQMNLSVIDIKQPFSSEFIVEEVLSTFEIGRIQPSQDAKSSVTVGIKEIEGQIYAITTVNGVCTVTSLKGSQQIGHRGSGFTYHLAGTNLSTEIKPSTRPPNSEYVLFKRKPLLDEGGSPSDPCFMIWLRFNSSPRMSGSKSPMTHGEILLSE